MSLYKTLKNDSELLETYNKIFKEQLSPLGIIEQIDTPNSKPGLHTTQLFVLIKKLQGFVQYLTPLLR